VVIGADGLYRLRGEATVSGLNTGDTAGWVFYKNGALLYRGPDFSSGASTGVVAEYMALLEVGDEITATMNVSIPTFTVNAGALFSVVQVAYAR
jgi:hypothetical protein